MKAKTKIGMDMKPKKKIGNEEKENEKVDMTVRYCFC